MAINLDKTKYINGRYIEEELSDLVLVAPKGVETKEKVLSRARLEREKLSKRFEDINGLSFHTYALLKRGIEVKSKNYGEYDQPNHLPILTIGQLVMYSKDDLFYYGFSQRALKELEDLLFFKGLKFKENSFKPSLTKSALNNYREAVRKHYLEDPKTDWDKINLHWDRILSRAEPDEKPVELEEQVKGKYVPGIPRQKYAEVV